MKFAWLTILIAVLATVPVMAQAATIADNSAASANDSAASADDSGTFRISVERERVETEQFFITQSGTGAGTATTASGRA